MSVLQRVQEVFPMLSKTMHGKPLIYFDNAATTQKPRQVIDAITHFYQDHYGTVHRAVYELATYATHRYQEIRRQIAAFIHAERPEEIIYTRGTTESINLVASSFCKCFVKPGDEILISAMEHHSNIVPWQMACADYGATLRVIEIEDDGVLKMDSLRKLLNERTKIVAIAHVSNTLGTINPIKEITSLAHAAGAKVLVDGAQAAPHLPVDVQELGADFYVFSGHKIYGPTGIGVLYGRSELLGEMPPYQGGGDMIETVTFEKTTYNTPPLKFEAGTPMIAEVIGLGAALSFIQSIGLEAIAQWEHHLLTYATERVLSIPGLKILGTAPRKGAIITFTVDGIHPLDIGTLLDLRGIAIRTGHHCAQPVMNRFNLHGAARASFGLYNTKEEVDQFVFALDEIVKILKK